MTCAGGLSEVLTIQTKGAAHTQTMAVPRSQTGTSAQASAVPGTRLSSSGDEGARGSATLSVEGEHGMVDGGVEVVRVAERAVGQVVALQVAPGTLDVVQLRRVLREPLDGEPGPRGQRLPARLARVDRAVVEHQHHRPVRPARPRRVAPVEPGQQVGEVAGALGAAGDHDQLARGVVERAEGRALLRPTRRLAPEVRAALRPAVGQVGVGQRLGLVPEQEVDVAGGGLLLQQPQPDARALDRVAVLAALDRVPGTAPAVAPLRSTTPRWPGEIVSPVRAVTSAASRARVQTGRSAAEPRSTSRATASATSRFRGVRPGRGRDRNAAAPPERTAARQRRTCSARTPSRAAIAALVSPSTDQSTARARSASTRTLDRPSRSSAARPSASTANAHRPPMPASPALPASNLGACAFISRPA